MCGTCRAGARWWRATVREEAVERDLLGGDRDQAVVLVHHHRLGGEIVLRVSDLVLRRDEERERPVEIADRRLERLGERDALVELVGEVDGDQLGVVVGVELEAALLEPAAHLPVVRDLTVVDDRHVGEAGCPERVRRVGRHVGLGRQPT